MEGWVYTLQMDYINTSHPNFVGGNKAVDIALQELRGVKDVHDWKEPGVDRLPLPEKAAKARAILARTNASTINAYEHIAAKPLSLHQEKPGTSGKHVQLILDL
jgi:dynamin 1-like protein